MNADGNMVKTNTAVDDRVTHSCAFDVALAAIDSVESARRDEVSCVEVAINGVNEATIVRATITYDGFI